jgi:cytoskeleton protein RodZ
VSTEGKTIGEMLRAAREERKLSVEQVNRETKISVQSIRAMEQDDFGSFPSETYLKGFLRTYAEFLGLDSGKMWSMMAARSPAVAPGTGPTWDVESSVREERLGAPRVVRRVIVPLMIVAIVVLLVLLMRERRRPAGVGMRPAAVGAVEVGGVAA